MNFLICLTGILALTATSSVAMAQTAPQQAQRSIYKLKVAVVTTRNFPFRNSAASWASVVSAMVKSANSLAARGLCGGARCQFEFDLQEPVPVLKVDAAPETIGALLDRRRQAGDADILVVDRLNAAQLDCGTTVPLGCTFETFSAISSSYRGFDDGSTLLHEWVHRGQRRVFHVCETRQGSPVWNCETCQGDGRNQICQDLMCPSINAALPFYSPANFRVTADSCKALQSTIRTQ